MSNMQYAAVRTRLLHLEAAFSRFASGEAQRGAVEQLKGKIEGAVRGILSRHVATSASISETRVDAESMSVVVHGMPAANGKMWADRSYVGLSRWWPFARGRIPMSLMSWATKQVAGLLVAELGGKAPPEAQLVLAEEGAKREERRVKARTRAAAKRAAKKAAAQ
jgi:hypothetical protein